MKIYDIISEETNLNEGFWAEFAKWVMGPTIKRKDIVEKISEKWAAEIIEAYERGVAPKLSTGIRRLIPNKFRNDVNSILDDALALAKRKVAGRAVSKGVEKGAAAGAKMFKAAYDGAMLYGVGRPIAEMIYNINELYNEYDQGKLPAENLQHSVQAEITKATQDVLAVWLGGKIIKKIVGAAGWLPSKLPFGMGEKIQPMFDKLSQAGRASFAVWLQTDQGQELFAKWLVGEALITAALGIPGEGVEKFISKSFRQASTWFSKVVKTQAVDPIIQQMKPDAPVAAASPQAANSKKDDGPKLQVQEPSGSYLAPKGRDVYGRPIQ